MLCVLCKLREGRVSEWMDRRMSAHRTLSPATAARHLRQLRQLRQLRVRGCRHRFLTGRCRGQVPRSALGHRQGPAREAESYAYWCAYMYGVHPVCTRYHGTRRHRAMWAA